MTSPPGRVARGALFAVAFALFVATASRAVGWWDDSHYPLLAATLSITNAPGSLLLTVLGWLWTRVIFCPTFAFQLHVLAAALGAATVTGAAWSASRVTRSYTVVPMATTRAGVLAGLWLMSAFHVWTYATQFTPYTLTMLFTALLLMAFLRWWERADATNDPAGLALVALLLGLDFSVHRTNQLLAAGLVTAVLLRRPGILLDVRAMGAVVLAYALGFATQLGYLVLSARRPLLDAADLHSLADLWRFIRLDQMGGSFLVDLWPRRADPIRVQLADWVRFLWTNLGAEPITRAVALALVLAGVVALLRRSPRLGWALLALFLSAGLGAVIYFNRPVAYMRPLDRHYLPSLVLLVPFVGAGLHAVLQLARPLPASVRLAPAALALWLVGWNVAANFKACDRSHTRYAETVARDLLEPLPPRAILFTNGDNDTFPLLYLQQVEHVRTDVLVANVPLSWQPYWRRRLAATDAMFAHVDFGDHPAAAIVDANRWRRPVYVAVAVVPEAAPELAQDLVLEGLASRKLPPGSAAPSNTALERFVVERLPRLGLRDQRQVLEQEEAPLMANYVYAATQLFMAQMQRGDTQAAWATLELVDREASGAPPGVLSPEMRTYINSSKEMLRDRAGRLGSTP